VILDRFSMAGRVAVVTAAGRGIGAASALALAEAGGDVVIAARTESQLVDVAERVAATGRRAVVVVGDLYDLDTIAALPEVARREFGRLDAVVNNLGGSMPLPFLDTEPEFLARSFHENLVAGHALTRAAVPLMLAGDGGAVVHISSVMGRIAGRGFLAYGTSKGALTQYTHLASKDLAPRVRVNAIGVGSTATSALDGVLTDEGLRTAMEEATPLRRIAEPEEIAAAVLYLCSDASAFVTGQVLGVDGGIDVPNLDFGLPDL
jgi:7-alpha-hydroxysteroid dehydrogenase